MATAGYGRAPYKSGGDGEKFHKWILRPEIYEEPQNVSQKAGKIDSTGVAYEGGNSADILISELELMLKKKTFTRSETQHLIAVLRTFEESPSPVIRLEASTTSGSMKRHKHGDESHNCHAAGFISSRVPAEEIASPAYGYENSTIVTSQAPRQDSKFINKYATCLPKTPMASPQHPTAIDNLPDELLVNIFIRLFAKQLAQMRSVSKSWNALLSRSSFIESHFHRSIHTNDRIHLHFKESSSLGFQSFTAHPCRSAHLQRTNCIKLPDNSESECKDIRVIGSVNGLICSSYSDSVIHIWNPSLSAVLTLPPYSMPSIGYDSLLIYFRFGFDPKTDDYKVIKLTGLIRQEYIDVIEWWLDVEIYSMRKGAWELITERFPSHIGIISDDDQICVDGHDGHLHWYGYSGEGNNTKTIVAFDLGSQTFREIPYPDFTLDDNVDDRLDYLGVLAGKLCVMSWVGDVRCDVWVMEEYGVAESWVKRHVISQFSGDTYPFGFTSHNDFLIEDIHGHLVFYDPVANKAKIVENYRLEEYAGDAGKLVEYVDSLVWVAPAKPEMVDGAGQNRNGEV